MTIFFWYEAPRFEPAEAKVAGSGQLQIKQLSDNSNSDHMCAIASDSKAYCWGNRANGRLGDGGSTSGSQNSPIAVAQGVMPAGATIRQIAVAYTHTCAIASDNKAYCWGNAANGRLGNGATTPAQNTPVAVSQGAMPAGATILQIDAGFSHTCAIASDNKVYCWGNGASGQLGNGSTSQQTTPVAVSQGAMPAGATIRSINVGEEHSCAIASDNKAYCWGAATYGLLGNGATTPNRTTPVAVSQGAMPAGSTILKINTGRYHTCALASDNKVYCWGGGWYGQFGNGGTVQETTPVAVSQGAMPAGSTVVDIMTGEDFTCAIASNNNAYCWGGNSFGQLGDNSKTQRTTPVAVAQGSLPAGATIRQLTGGATHTCALASDNKAYCWGGGHLGQIGNGSTSQQSTPTAVSTISSLAEIAQSVFRVFGESSSATPGSPLASDNSAAVLSSIGSNFRIRLGLTNKEIVQQHSVNNGGSHSCVISADSKGYCWGNAANGRLGNGSSSPDQTTPVAISQGDMPSGATFREISAGPTHTCAVASDHKAYCWGPSGNNQLGNGSTSSQTTPTAVSQGAMPSGATILQIDTGIASSCVIASDNKAYCWGSGSYGRLGNGSNTSQPTAVAVSQGAMPSGATFRQIAVAHNHTCAIGSDNKAYCWGENTDGRLGNGLNSNTNTPVAVSQGAMPSGATVLQIAVGELSTCAVASDHKAYCWGHGGNGRLGNGSTSSSNTPVAVSQGDMPSGATIIQVTVGGSYACAIASDHKAYCWGDGNYGRLGNGASSGDQTVPDAVLQGAIPSNTAVYDISAGDAHTCASFANDRVYCWGYGGSGRLGNGDTVDQTSAVDLGDGAMNDGPTMIGSSSLSLKLQVAPKGVATCSAVASGWVDVGTSSAMNWGSSPPTHTTSISSFGSDPAAPNTGGYAYQSIIQSGSSFTNNVVMSAQATGLWDIVLHDSSDLPSKTYCIRAQALSGAVDEYTYYPEITTAAGSLDLRFVDNVGAELTGSDKNTVFPNALMKNNTQTSVTNMTDTTTKQLEVQYALENTSWNVSTAATNGTSALWQSGSNTYDYNSDISSNGQLSVDLAGASISAHGTTPSGTACTTSGVSLGSAVTAFSSTVSAITLLSGSASTLFNCKWRVQNIVLSQVIPASQAMGTYSIDLTTTIVAN